MIFSTKIKEKPIFITLTQNSGIRVKIKALKGLDLHLLYVPNIMVWQLLVLSINFGHIDTDK